MATSKECKDFILEQLDLLDNITCKSMMEEFLQEIVIETCKGL